MHFLPTEQELKANSNANIRNNLFIFFLRFYCVVIRLLFFVFLFVSYLTTCTGFFFFFCMHIASFFFFYWHTSHSSSSCSHTLQLQRPYMSPCSFKEQWQSQLQFLHFVIFYFFNIIKELITVFSSPFTIIFYVPFTGLSLPVVWNIIPYSE